MIDVKIPLRIKKIVGPNGNWWIDEQGNMYLKGNLVIGKGMDPTFFTCVNQASAPSGMPNNSLWVNNQTLTFRNSSGNDLNVNFGDLIGGPTDAVNDNSDTDISQTVSGSESDNVTSAIINVNSTSHKVWITGGFIWGRVADQTEQADLSGAVAVTLVAQSTLGSTNNTIGGSVFQYVHSPASTGNKTYNLDAFKNSPNNAYVFGGFTNLVEGQ